MSIQDEPKGNAGHAKGMASAVHPHTSERGNTYPRLDLSIDYRNPKHIRLRAYDADGHVVDSLGCNDIAETLIWAAATIRYGETMFASKLREQINRAQSQRDGSGYPPHDAAVLKRTKQLMGTDQVRPAQAENYEQLLQPGRPMLQLLDEIGADQCRRVADMTLTLPLEDRTRANELMAGLPRSHVWFRGICAYAVAAGHIR